MANALLLPTTYEDKLDIPGSILKGQQIRANMDNNAMAPYRQKAAENQNAMSDLQLQQAQQGDSLKSIQTKAERLKLQREGSLALLGSAKHIIDVYSKDPELANKLYQPLVKTANEYGVGASSTLNIDEMKSFVAGVEGGNKKTEEVMPSPQLYTNPKNGRSEMWYFDKTGQPKSFVRNATQQDIKGSDSFGDRELVKNTIKELPKLKEDAMKQNYNIQTIDKALTLLRTGNVTGKGGQIKTILQPYAEMMGVNTQGMDDAQTYQLLTRSITGPMRLDIIGSGPVSEYEQKLMKEMSGGGSTGQAAASELLNYYKGMAKQKVGNYNQTLEGAIGLDSNIGRIHKPINMNGSAPGGNIPNQSAPLTATNPKTGQKIKSIDGGKTWIQASADNPQLAQVTAEDVPIGSGMASQAKSLIQLRRELNDAYLKGDDQRAQDIERQIQQMNSQQKNVG